VRVLLLPAYFSVAGTFLKVGIFAVRSSISFSSSAVCGFALGSSGAFGGAYSGSAAFGAVVGRGAFGDGVSPVAFQVGIFPM